MLPRLGKILTTQVTLIVDGCVALFAGELRQRRLRLHGEEAFGEREGVTALGGGAGGENTGGLD